MSDTILQSSVADSVAVRGNNALMTPQESERAETSKEYTVILIEHKTMNSRTFDYISVEDYRKVLAKEEGFGITEIVMGVGEVILGTLTIVAGVLLLQPWMIGGGSINSRIRSTFNSRRYHPSIQPILVRKISVYVNRCWSRWITFQSLWWLPGRHECIEVAGEIRKRSFAW